MAEFLQSYGIWIFVGILFLLMLRAHRHGGGSGMEGHRHDPRHHPDLVQGKDKEKDTESGKRSSGCH